MFAYALASTLCSEATNIAYCLSLAVGAKSELMLENLGIHQSKFKLRMSSLDAVKRSIFIDYRGGGFVCLFLQLYKLEFRIDFYFPLLYSYYKKSGSPPLPNELKIVDTIVLKG